MREAREIVMIAIKASITKEELRKEAERIDNNKDRQYKSLANYDATSLKRAAFLMEESQRIAKIAQKHGLSKDDLIQESELVEDCGEYLHIYLAGYDVSELRCAAEML